jgi:AAA15 family ATPase/GTPase
MIVNFSVQNFGSIKEKQTLSFEADKSTHLEDYYIIHTVGGLRLLKLGLIYGANASGKTTILKALDFLRHIVLNPEDKKSDSFHFKPFLFDSVSSKSNSILSIEFIQNETRYFYEVELNQRAIVNETLNHYKPTKANVFKRSTDLEKQFTQIAFGGKIKKDKTFEKALESNTLWNNTVLGGFLKTNINSKELKEVTDWFSEYLAPLVLTETKLDDYVSEMLEKSKISKYDIINILSKADFNISDVTIENLILKNITLKDDEPRNKLKSLGMTDDYIDKFLEKAIKKIEFEHTVNNEKYTIPFGLESQGTKRYYGFAGILIALIKGSTAIPIDELEASLHPDLFVHFLLSFLVNSKKSQIIATTHNREVLNNKDIFRNDAIWFTDKNEDSATQLYALSDFDTSVIRDTSNVYNAYKIGKLGGVPNLSDYYINATPL